ncbi:mitochondrial complex I protein Fmp36 [Metarhizium album ARSEF 1941]|uniref:Mitochondrial zinc maintenance protein 1, mitochondrial n=1 Tax=Metarhizium album (strain ARSEF 1941) TaxID=1081103 RepID=A0A0B2WLR7_METAS|nr:mitochondrial complex I protein Fmp36 [Metarhizium album ARSEF 1941]KHN94427.1 mitochondrial complex I protein Fmp36 [Metarhizium album ARSEF 1941]
MVGPFSLQIGGPPRKSVQRKTAEPGSVASASPDLPSSANFATELDKFTTQGAIPSQHLAMALVAYRNLMRAARIAFEGDAPILAAAQQQIRDVFRQRSSLDSSDPSTREDIQRAQEIADFLKANVVQGKRMEGGDNMYRLRIHEHTERGDNDSIKTAGSGVVGGGCCGESRKIGRLGKNKRKHKRV